MKSKHNTTHGKRQRLRCLFLLRTQKKPFQVFQEIPYVSRSATRRPKCRTEKTYRSSYSALWLDHNAVPNILSFFSKQKRQCDALPFSVKSPKNLSIRQPALPLPFSAYRKHFPRCFFHYQQNINLKSGIISEYGVRPKNSPYSVARPKTYQGAYHDNKKY